jgi:hypothetical protein
MTELEKIKLELFGLVERVGAILIRDENTFVFTKEQLYAYSKFLLNEAMDNVKTGIKNDLDEDCLDEAIEIELNYNREILVNIDIRAVHCQIREIIEGTSTEYSDLEDPIDSALRHVFPVDETIKTFNEAPYGDND